MTAGSGLAAGAYLTGSVAVAATVAALCAGAYRVRAVVLPSWAGVDARLAESVIAIGTALAVAQLLGSVHAFAPLPVFGALVLVSIAMIAVARPSHTAAAAAPEAKAEIGIRTEPRWHFVLGALGAGVLLAQWTAHVAFTLGRGMTHPDTLWYHAPFAARFVQEHAFSGLGQLGYPATRYFPLDAELVHALLILPFRRDLLSPFVNLGWVVVALAAAWSAGRRHACASLTLLGCVAALAVPTITGTQPGQASNDVPCAALLVVAVALLLRDHTTPAAVALGGAAAGLSLSTRLVVAAPIAVITVGIVVISVRAQRRATALAWCGGLLATGSYWFIRNWVSTGSPLPYLNLGPLRARITPEADPLSAHLFSRRYWRVLYLPGLPHGWGRAWPMVGVILVVAVGAPFWRRRPMLERVFALAVVAGAIEYVFSPQTGNLSFAFNLRYLAPAMLVAFVMLPIALGPRGRDAVAIVYGAFAAISFASAEHERIAAWPSRSTVAIGVVAVAALALATVARRRAGALSRARIVTVSAAMSIAVIAIGWPVQRSFFRHRYVDAGLFLDRANAQFRSVSHARVAVFGAVEVYPFFGTSLTNEVALENIADRGGKNVCARWRTVRSGAYDYVVYTLFGVVLPQQPPQRWFTSDANSREVLHDGVTRVYKISGPLHPPECA